MSTTTGDKKRKFVKEKKWSADRFPEKRAATSDVRRSKLHVNQSNNLRGYAMVLGTYVGHEGKATVELHRIFASYIDALTDEAAETTSEQGAAETVAEDATLTASDLLQQELDELKAESRNHTSTAKTVKMLTVRTNCKGVVMLRIGSRIEENAIEPRVDVQSIVDKVYESISESGSCCRLLVKVIPMQYTCFAGPEEIEAQLKPLIEHHFKGEPCTYMVALKRRNNNMFDKDAMVNIIGDLVGPLHKVDLKRPEKVIVVEINQSLAGISIVTGGNYHKYSEYNIRKYQEQVRNKDKVAEERNDKTEAITEAPEAVVEKHEPGSKEGEQAASDQ